MQSQSQVTPGRTHELLSRYRAFSRNPGNLDLIRDQLAFMREESSVGTGGLGPAGFSELISFLISQAVHVKEEDLGALAELLEGILQEQAEQPDANTCGNAEDGDLCGRLAQFRAALSSYDLPESPKDLRLRLEEASELRDFALELGGGVNDIELHIFQVQTSLQVLTLADEFQAMFQAAKGAKDLTASAYLLQQCEATLRQSLALEVSLGSRAKGTGYRLLADLKAESLSLRDRTQKAESEELWKAFNQDYREKLMRIKEVDLVTTNMTMKKHLEDLNWAVKLLQQVLAKLTHPDLITPALEELEKLHSLLQKAAETQHKRYNKWALERIREAYVHGLDHVGIIDDETEIGEVLSAWLGPIDSRYLTAEVQRCYSEVFEYLYGHLDKPGDKKDFEAKGNKLYVLKQLMDREKQVVSDQ